MRTSATATVSDPPVILEALIQRSRLGRRMTLHHPSDYGTASRRQSKRRALIDSAADDCVIPAPVTERHFEQLVRAVEGEIVPRLLIARRNSTPVAVPANAADLDVTAPEELARLLLQHDIEVPYAYAQAQFFRGVSIRDLYVQLLAPAAKCLGTMWEQDRCDFMQVTLGLGRLHQLLRRIGMLEQDPVVSTSPVPARCALLVTVPGETHSFGVTMLSHFFRQRGWIVCNEYPTSEDELAACVSERSFALVGLSSGSESLADSLAAAVRCVKRWSLNKHAAIMAGGALLLLKPGLARRVGADATAADGERAVALAEKITASLTSEK